MVTESESIFLWSCLRTLRLVQDITLAALCARERWQEFHTASKESVRVEAQPRLSERVMKVSFSGQSRVPIMHWGWPLNGSLCVPEGVGAMMAVLVLWGGGQCLGYCGEMA